MSSALMILFFLIFLGLGIPVVGSMGLAAIVYLVGWMGNIPMSIVAN